MFDTLIAFLKVLFEKVTFDRKKSVDDNKSMKKYPACKELEEKISICVENGLSMQIGMSSL